jgi:hypothetical protein
MVTIEDILKYLKLKHANDAEQVRLMQACPTCPKNIVAAAVKSIESERVALDELAATHSKG